MITHPRLVHAIMCLRPGSRPLIDFIVEDNGSGPTLREGSMVNPPTQEEVDAVTVEQLDEAQASKVPKDPVRIQLLADVASLKTRLETAEAAVADIASINDRLAATEAAVADVASLKTRLDATEAAAAEVAPVVDPPIDPVKA